MSGIELEKAEFAYLLATLHATSVVGVDDPALFPTEREARDGAYGAGFDRLQEHGWLKPAEQPGQLILDDLLLLMTAVVVDPAYVVFTARNSGGGNQQLLLHYLAGPEIVELSTTPDQKYRIGLVPDRAAMLQRIQEMLGLPGRAEAPRFQFNIEEQAFQAIQNLVGEGKRKQAAALLREQGVNGTKGESLLAALSATDSGGMIAVARASGGEIAAGRKVTVFRQADAVWLMQRIDATTTTLSLETVQPDTLSTVLGSYFEFLQGSGGK
ncbi:MAG: hypothetical protein AAB382_10055 [Chloroflexota bacterium]